MHTSSIACFITNGIVSIKIKLKGGIMEFLNIEGHDVILEQLRSDHIQEYLQQFSQTIQSMLRVDTISSERDYLEQQCACDNQFFYIIRERSTRCLIGAIEIRNGGYRSQLYCWLNEHWWGAGYFQEAISYMLYLYFALTNQEAIFARVDQDNSRSYHALKKAGFLSRGLVDGPYGKQYELTFRRS